MLVIRSILCAAIGLTVGYAAWTGAAEDQTSSADSVEFFESRIRPVLVKHCYRCHSSSAEKLEGGLRLDSREGLNRGGDSGPVLAVGRPEESLLIRALRYESLEMPPDQKLPPAIVADFAHWIEMGAPDPRDTDPRETGGAAPRSAESAPASNTDWEAARQVWSFRSPQIQDLPAGDTASWSRSRSDRFVFARLANAGLQPNHEAERAVLVRRLSFDLTGLPPTPDDIAQFERDTNPDAYERLVDRWLASPHYGERWTRLWLDVARYAEDQAHIVGDDKELFYPNAYRYRDWVTNALNADLPYDRFVKLQLAADQLEPESDANHVALGFLGLGPKYYRREAPEVMADEWEDRVDTVGRGLLGLTIACARCHHHKYDPIPTEDYYALAGVFASTEMFNRPLDSQREKNEHGQAKKPEDSLHIVRDGTPTDLHVFIRGDIEHQGGLVPRHFLRVLSPSSAPALSRGSGRIDLAEAIVAPGNPLAARVIVNRIWGQQFGLAIVRTPSNFGKLGEPPTHPELLDDLTVRFMESGWSLKWLQRELVLSSAYRQSSRIDATQQAVDPANLLLSRMNRRRMGVEAWRDTLLSVAGQLDQQIGGPSLDPDDPSQRRRTVYSRISRLDLNRMLALFDFPDPNAHSSGRSATTTPLQKLFVLNSPWMTRLAEQFANRLYADYGPSDALRIEGAYQLIYGRSATQVELRLGLAYLSQAGPDETRWPAYAQSLLAATETFMLD